MKHWTEMLPIRAMAPVKRREIITVGAFALVAAVALTIFNGSVQFSVENRRARLGALQNPLMFDGTMLSGKHHGDVEGLQPDGTYLLYRDEFGRGPMGSCRDLVQEKERVKSIHYYYPTCKLFDRQFGNRLATIYGIKMFAHVLEVPFKFTCGLSEGEVPNGAGYLNNVDGVVVSKAMPYSAEEICDMCTGMFCTWWNSNLALASDFMAFDWRYLTQGNVVDVEDHDDAVIHLRLGDGLYSTLGTNEAKGVFPHQTYINLLMQAQQEKGAITSIGISTAPFKGNSVRLWDEAYTSMSEMVALDLVQALQNAFPQAKIRIHNSPDSTIMESMARLVHARKIVVCGCSTFCPYPLMAAEGIAYVYKPVEAFQNAWVIKASEQHPNFRLFETPMLNGMMISNEKTGFRLHEAHIMNWLRNQDVSIGNVDIVEPPLFRSAGSSVGI